MGCDGVGLSGWNWEWVWLELFWGIEIANGIVMVFI